MIQGFENNKWYIDYTACDRAVGTLRQEHLFRAKTIAENSNKIMLSNSGGTDSQVMLLSFIEQHIPFESVFLYLPGYNDHEYRQVQEVDKKWNLSTQIIDLDPYEFKEEFEQESLEHNIQIYSILHKKFFTLVPDDCDFVSNITDPYIHMDLNNNPFWFQGHNSYEVVRQRAFELVNRKGRFLFWGDSSEMLASTLSDEVVSACNASWRYMRGNGLTKPNAVNVFVHSLDKWDYFIKPILYGKHWKDEILYFPKSQGFEKIDFLNNYYPMFKNGMMTPFNEFVDFLINGNGKTQRYYENVSDEPISS